MLPCGSSYVGASQVKGQEVSQSECRFMLIDQLRRASDPKEIESLIFHIGQHPETRRRSVLIYYPEDALPKVIKSAMSIMELDSVHDNLFVQVANGLNFLKMEKFAEFRKCIGSAITSSRKTIGDTLNRPNSRCLVTNLRKLEMLITWELLLGDITEAFLNWDSLPPNCNQDTLVDRCEETIKGFQSIKPHVRPRSEIVEAALMFLLNCGRFELVINCSRARHGWPLLEFFTLIARISINVQNETYFSSNFRDVWNCILPLFITSSGVKRNSSSSEGILPNLSTFKWVLAKVKSGNMVKIFISILVKLHNFDTEQEALGMRIQVELLERWPNFLDESCETGSTSKYKKSSGITTNLNITAIRELLVELLEAQENRRDNNFDHLKILGHVHLHAKNPFRAMKYYVEYLAQGTEFFELDFSRIVKPDEVFEKMIKASYLLGNFIQATILCQFLSVTDYTTAFGMISETTSAEPWAGLFEFFWDQTILEYMVNFYSKRSTLNKERREQVLRIIRQLELNEHNNDEIKHAAVQIRKVHFMRTLVNTYLLE